MGVVTPAVLFDREFESGALFRFAGDEAPRELQMQALRQLLQQAVTQALPLPARGQLQEPSLEAGL